VEIKRAGSADELLDAVFLSAEIKQSGLRALGLMLDADDNCGGRWRNARGFFQRNFTDVPIDLPGDGLVLENNEGLRCGLWIMPDNSSTGMLETFCAHLVPSNSLELWTYAEQAFNEARDRGARWRDCHRAKVQMHTWLAWQDPPGERIGTAISRRILDPHSPGAQAFVRWFKRLYRVP
jgi:hypothetical protein